MAITTDTKSRTFKDPANLTEYEKKLIDLKNRGMTHKQIAESYKASVNTISNKFTTINQKLKLAEMEK
jgi:DNA-binding NarL/FixJ family response regulator